VDPLLNPLKASAAPARSSATTLSVEDHEPPRAAIHGASDATISGNCEVLSLPARDAIRTRAAPPERASASTIARIPSYFRS